MENLNKISNHEFLGVLKQSLPREYKSTVNIIEFKDGILYAWNETDSSILSLNIEFQMKHSKTSPFQILRLINPPVFEVERLLINKTNTQCAVIGSKGIVIVRIPRRWGIDGIFEGGKSEITCGCSILDEPYFACKSSLRIKQVRWHPASLNSTHIVVLTTDDTLRLYDIQNMNLKAVWHPGRAFHSSSMSQSSLGRGVQTLVSLGETAIDFDFTPPVIVGDINSDKSEIEWPILILRGNGDIFVLTASLENKKNVKIEGPLPVYPPVDDNYSMEDASSLIVLNSVPPIVAIATCSGNIYHSLLLSLSDEEDTKMNESIETESIQPYHVNTRLYMFECIELELGISADDTTDLYSSPICLYTDPYVPSRYFCLHEAGLHAVILPIVLDLDKYAKSSEDDADQYLPSLRQSQSVIEYLICTRINADDPSQHFSSPLIGFRITEHPCFLIALSVNGELTSLPLTSTTLVRQTKKIPAITEINDDNDSQTESFDVHIQNILKPETGSSRPIFKLAPNVPLPSETCIEILNQEIDGLREDYFSRYHSAIKDIERRIKLMSIMKKKQSEEVHELETKYDEIQKKGEVLKEMCQKIKEKQETFRTRSCEVLKKTKKKQIQNTAVQKQIYEKSREYSNTVQILSSRVDEVCKRHDYQKKKIKETADQLEKSDYYLSDDQHAIIINNLRQMGEEISQVKNLQLDIKRTADFLIERYDNKMNRIQAQ